MKVEAGGFRLGYREDIEGLRGIAILLVVATHVGVTWLPGGFVGVDVFYVLSGYLITGLLVQESATTGHMRFANFYARRFRRLLPALLLMVAVTCLVANVVMPPTELPEQASNATSAVWWLSNFQFAFWNMDYFAPQADTALFLHTWSLGVEEQFYMVWPLLVVVSMGAWKYARHINVARLKWVFGAIFTASFALSFYWTYHSPLFAFYMMPSRAWQFAVGAIVFLLVGSPAFRVSTDGVQSPWIRLMGWAGLGMILLASLIVGRSVPYPGTWALLPTFGTALILAADAQHQASVGRFLSWRPMQALGRVSYSWYLWHWPVLLLGATLLNMSNNWNLLLLVVVSLLIAATSYHAFETPIRRNRKLVAKPRWTIALAFAVMIVAVLPLRIWRDEAKGLAASPTLAPFVAARTDFASNYAEGCVNRYPSTKVQFCMFGDPRATHTAVLMGDSKAMHWLPAYQRLVEKPGWRLLVIEKEACPMVDAPFFLPSIHRRFTECERWRRDVMRRVASLQPDVIVLGESFEYPLTKQQWIAGTRHVLATLADHAQRIYLIRPTPVLPFNGPLCLQPRGRLYEVLASKSHCTAEAHTALFDHVGRWLQVASAPFRNAQFVDMTDSLCPGGICRAERGGTIVFSDTGHMTTTFARTLAPALAEALDPSDPHALTTPKAGASQPELVRD